jgi:hypothetical protein
MLRANAIAGAFVKQWNVNHTAARATRASLHSLHLVTVLASFDVVVN